MVQKCCERGSGSMQELSEACADVEGKHLSDINSSHVKYVWFFR